MRVLAALSGGVDSAVATALAVEAGHDVVGVHMALSAPGSMPGHVPADMPAGMPDGGAQGFGGENGLPARASRGCFSPQNASDAAQVAAKLGIPFEIWDLSAEFSAKVVADFLGEYRAGRTPNPCVRCNEYVKFQELLRRGLAAGFDAVCTGHYAQVFAGQYGSELHRSVDPLKDQSYVLAVMGLQNLGRVMFPLGGFASKAEVRLQAQARGLQVSDKPDSFDICFIPSGDTAGFLRERLGESPGEIRDVSGQVVGEHRGAYAYTVGQRKGLRLGRPATDGKPRYVLRTDVQENVVIVGPNELLSVNQVNCDNVVWLAPEVWDQGKNLGEIDGLVDAIDAGQANSVALVDSLSVHIIDQHGTIKLEGQGLCVQMRAHGEPVPATVTLTRNSTGLRLQADLLRSVRGIAAGQSLVVYAGSRALGQATITDTAGCQKI